MAVSFWAYVIMPEHVHVLLYPENESYEMRRILDDPQTVRGPESQAILADERTEFMAGAPQCSVSVAAGVPLLAAGRRLRPQRF